MGLRFRKSFKIAPGVKINLNKKSFGLSIGTKGARYTINSKGKHTVSTGVPGTGISYSKTFSTKKSKKSSSVQDISPADMPITTANKKEKIKQSPNKKIDKRISTNKPHNTSKSLKEYPVTTQKFFQYFCLIVGIFIFLLGLLLVLVSPICIVFPILGILFILYSHSIKKHLKSLEK